jgi:DNA-binding beta-propeller fold protein YncE
MGIRKATKTHLKIYTKNQVRVNNPQGIAVVRLKSWDNPNDKKDDDEVTGYGINSGENLIIYNTSMTSLGIYGMNEKGERALLNPTGVAANEDGDVYVADSGKHRVVRFKNPQKNLEFVRAIGGYGSLPGQFNSPRGIAMDSRGMVYVCDWGNHRIQVLRPDDVLHVWFGKQGTNDGEIWHPSGITVTDAGERWSYYKDEFIAIIDLDNQRLQKFTLDGKFLKSIRLNDFGYPSGQLVYLATDYYSNVWVTDTENHCVHKFDRELNYLTSFGRKGTGDKEFLEPRGIAIYKRFGQVFVAEKQTAQYYWIGTDIFNVESSWNPNRGFAEIHFFLTEPSYVTLSVETDNEKPVEVFAKKQYFSGPQTLYFDGRLRVLPGEVIEHTRDGIALKIVPLPEGKHTIKLKVEPTYSSYKYFSKEVSSEFWVKK